MWLIRVYLLVRLYVNMNVSVRSIFGVFRGD